MKKRFATPDAFRRSLEERLKRRALTAGRTLERERQLVVFERFLARLFVQRRSDLVVKGGLALELRTALARTTNDVDLRATGNPSEFQDFASHAGFQELGDYLSFSVAPHPSHPKIQAAGMQYEGQRYRVQGQLAGKSYGNPFSMDVAFGEPILGEPDVIRGRVDLAFAGLEPPELRVYPRVTHIAEKLHAYTLPRPSLNSRVKDLPDIAILASIGPIESDALRAGLERTFAHRATHTLPDALPAPPGEWRASYERMADVDRLRWKSLDEVHAAASSFLDPSLRGEQGHWKPSAWVWVLKRDASTDG